MPKQVYIYGDSLLKATMPDEGYHYHFHYDEVLQRYPERRTQVVNRSKMGATISKGESLVQHDLDRGLGADYALVATTVTTTGRPSTQTRRGTIIPGQSCLPFGRSSVTR